MNILRLTAVAASLASGFFSIKTQAATNLITNGDFETGSLSGFTATGATAAGAVPYFGSGSTTLDGTTLAAFNGGGAASGGTLSQTFTTVAGGEYEVDYFVGVTGGTIFQTLGATVFGNDETTTLATHNASASNPGNVVPLALSTFTFVADGPQSTLQFVDLLSNGGPAGQDLTLDNISVIAVPEPATLGIVGLAASGLLIRRRQR